MKAFIQNPVLTIHADEDLRPSYANCTEAGSVQILYGIEWQAVENRGFQPRMVGPLVKLDGVKRDRLPSVEVKVNLPNLNFDNEVAEAPQRTGD